MKYEKVRQQLSALKDTISDYPVEIVSCVIFTVLWMSTAFIEIDNMENLTGYAPVIFLMMIILHTHMEYKLTRMFYYASPLLMLCCFFTEYRFTAQYLITLCIFQAVFILINGGTKNKKFMASAVSYSKALLTSLFFALTSTALIYLFFTTIHYLLDIWNDDYAAFEILSISFSLGLLFPTLFLMFHRKEVADDKQAEGKEPSFHYLVNFILSPALIVYTGILYIYIAKILVTQSLPKGMIAYMVISFISVLIILKGYQVLVQKKHYEWFYKYSSIISVAPLLLCWYGTYIRISQYGFTAMRIYLTAILVILTIVTVLFFFHKWRNYALATSIGIGIMSVITYIPGISAESIAERIQNNNPSMAKAEAKRGVFISRNDVNEINIEDYTKIYFTGNQESLLRCEVTADSLFLYIDNKIEYKNSISAIFAQQLRESGINRTDTIPQEKEQLFLQIKTDSGLILLDNLMIERSDKGDFPKEMYIKCYLKK